jgi:hypothetical protein
MGSIPKTSMDQGVLHKMPTYDRKLRPFNYVIDTDYDDKKPNVHNNFRTRDFQQEQGPPIMKYTHKDQMERIQDKILGTPKLSTEVSL